VDDKFVEEEVEFFEREKEWREKIRRERCQSGILDVFTF
jgi:hypothetical protein